MSGPGSAPSFSSASKEELLKFIQWQKTRQLESDRAVASAQAALGVLVNGLLGALPAARVALGGVGQSAAATAAAAVSVDPTRLVSTVLAQLTVAQKAHETLEDEVAMLADELAAARKLTGGDAAAVALAAAGERAALAETTLCEVTSEHAAVAHALRSDVARLERELLAAQSASKAVEMRLADVAADRAAIMTSRDTLRTALEALQAESEGSSAERALAAERLAAADQNAANLAASLASALAETETARANAGLLASQLAAAESRASDLESTRGELELVRIRYAELTRESEAHFRKLQAARETLEGQLAAAREETRAARAQLAARAADESVGHARELDMQRQLVVLNDELVFARREATAALAAADDARAERDRAQTALADTALRADSLAAREREARSAVAQMQAMVLQADAAHETGAALAVQAPASADDNAAHAQTAGSADASPADATAVSPAAGDGLAVAAHAELADARAAAVLALARRDDAERRAHALETALAASQADCAQRVADASLAAASLSAQLARAQGALDALAAERDAAVTAADSLRLQLGALEAKAAAQAAAHAAVCSGLEAEVAALRGQHAALEERTKASVAKAREYIEKQAATIVALEAKLAAGAVSPAPSLI